MTPNMMMRRITLLLLALKQFSRLTVSQCASCQNILVVVMRGRRRPELEEVSH